MSNWLSLNKPNKIPNRYNPIIDQCGNLITFPEYKEV